MSDPARTPNRLRPSARKHTRARRWYPPSACGRIPRAKWAQRPYLYVPRTLNPGDGATLKRAAERKGIDKRLAQPRGPLAPGATRITSVTINEERNPRSGFIAWIRSALGRETSTIAIDVRMDNGDRTWTETWTSDMAIVETKDTARKCVNRWTILITDACSLTDADLARRLVHANHEYRPRWHSLMEIMEKTDGFRPPWPIEPDDTPDHDQECMQEAVEIVRAARRPNATA